MLSTRRPFDRELMRMRKDIDSLMDWPTASLTNFEPEIDIHENENEIVIHAELPGISQDGIDVSTNANNQTLTISGEKTYEYKDDSDSNRVIHERRYGNFERTVPLPKNADFDGVKASMKEGVLNINVPKTDSDDEEGVRKIDIE